MHGHGMNLFQKIAAKLTNDKPYPVEVGYEVNAREIEKKNKGVEVIDIE